MTNRKRFPISLVALSASATLALSGCLTTMPTVPQGVKDFLPAALGGVAAITCYQNLGGGNMRLLTGAACGVGTYMLVKSLADNTDDKTAEGVKAEYQAALSARPNGTPPSGAPFDYAIRFQNKAGQPVAITLTVQRVEFTPPNLQCRAFREVVNEAGKVHPPTNRTACRQGEGAWAMSTDK